MYVLGRQGTWTIPDRRRSLGPTANTGSGAQARSTFSQYVSTVPSGNRESLQSTDNIPDFPDHRHATPVHSTPPSPTPPRRRGLHAAARSRVQVDARALRLLHGLPRPALLHTLRRPQALRGGRALRRRPARHPRRQRHRLRRPRRRQPHPPGRPLPARARPLRLLQRHPQDHPRPLRLPPRGHARLRRLAGLRRPQRPRLDPGVKRYPPQRGRRGGRRDRAARAAALRVLRRGGQLERGARRVPDVRGGEGGHRARHREEVPDHCHRRDELQRPGHRRRRRRGHHRPPAASMQLVVPHLHVGLRAGRGERDLRSDCRSLCPVQLWSGGQLGPVLRAGAATGGRGVLQHAVRQQQHGARRLHARDDRRRLQRHLLRLRRLRQRHNPHHVNHGTDAPVPRPAPVPATDPAADVVLLRDVPGPFTGANAVTRWSRPDDGTNGQPGRCRRRSNDGPALRRAYGSVRALPSRRHAVVTSSPERNRDGLLGMIVQSSLVLRGSLRLILFVQEHQAVCWALSAVLCQNLAGLICGSLPCKIGNALAELSVARSKCLLLM